MQKRIHNSATISWILHLMLVSAGFALCATGTITAQNTQRAQKEITSKKNQILTGRAPVSDPAFEQYYKQILFAPFRKSTRPDLFEKARAQLAKDFRAASANQPTYDALVKLVVDETSQFVGDSSLLPAARCNAMLILGALNSKQPRRGPPVPYAPAMSTMLGGLIGSRSIDPIRTAALVGIQRHVDLRTTFPSAGKLSAQEQSKITDAMLNIVSADKPPQGRSIAGHNWMRRNAAEILCTLGSPGQNGLILQAVQKLIADPKNSLSVRCGAAQAVGQITFGNAKPTPADVANDLLALAMECCARQQLLLETMETKGRLSVRESNDGVADPRTLSIRRELLTQLTAIRTGLIGANRDAGLKAQAGNAQAAVDGVATDVQRVIDVLTQLDTELPELGEELANRSSALQRRLSAL